jgi:F-type H+-transporting ATPase subunit gamma
MPTLEGLRSRVESTQEMQTIVKTMKALAAVNINQFQEAVEAIRAYNDTLEMSLQILLRQRSGFIPEEPAPESPLGIIVFGSEQGLAGQFNASIVNFTLDKIREYENTPQRVLVVGRRAIPNLVQNNIKITEEAAAPNSLASITAKVQDLIVRIERWRVKHGIQWLVLFHNTLISSASYEPRLRWLLPISPYWLRSLQKREWDSRTLPMITMDWQQLFAANVRQVFFVTLYRAFAESLASENASRLQAMQAAEKNIEEQLNRLQQQYHQLRQTSITEEILDIAAGFEALSSD